MPEAEFCVVIVSIADAARAEAIQDALLHKGLAACIQVQRVQSSYMWQGERCCDEELQLQIKTRTGLFSKLKDEVLLHHDYDVPEIIMLPVVDGHAPYLQWLDDVCVQA